METKAGAIRVAKFDTEMKVALPDLRKVVGGTIRLPDQHVREIYFDTPDFRLWRQGITLCHRIDEGGHSAGWSLHLEIRDDGPTAGRSELTWPDQEEVPSKAESLVKGIVRHAAIGQIAELAKTTHRISLYDPKGRYVGEVEDDLVAVAGGHRGGLRFRHVEVTLNDRGRKVAPRVFEKLRIDGVSASHESPLAKAVRLPRQQSSRLDKSATLGLLIQASIGQALGRILDHDYRMRLALPDIRPHDVHQARVATRRLRSNLKTFGQPLDPIWLGHTRAELKWLGDALGRVRDCDILATHLNEDRELLSLDTNGRVELSRSSMEQRKKNAEDLLEVINGERYLTLLDRLHAASDLPPFHEVPGARKSVSTPRSQELAKDVLPALIGRRFRSLQRRVRKGGQFPSDGDLHRIRIRAKQLRYATETATPVMGKRARQMAAKAEQIQNVLGDHHDAVTTEAWLRHQAAIGSKAASFSAGLLAAEHIRRQGTLRHQWQPTWRQLTKKKARDWLR